MKTFRIAITKNKYTVYNVNQDIIHTINMNAVFSLKYTIVYNYIVMRVGANLAS